MGIEPTFLAWEATFLPLEDTRRVRCILAAQCATRQRTPAGLAPLGGNITIQRETKVSLRNLLSFGSLVVALCSRGEAAQLSSL